MKFLRTNIEKRVYQIEAAIQRIETAVNRIEQKFGTETLASHRVATAIQAAGWGVRAEANRHEKFARISTYRPADPLPVSESLARLERLDPKIFPIWRQLFENDTQSYDKEGAELAASASVWQHQYARIFGAYLSLFASGRVLDIGAGVVGIPSYLAGIPEEHISLLDPREPKFESRCEFVRGFNEFLPWADGAFDTVVSGTSLDHVLSLEKSLSEVARVLAPGGRYVVWLASIPNAAPYRPDDPAYEPVDQFHLFHFDRAWIEPLFSRYFDFADITVIPQVGFDHVFYCLTPKAVPNVLPTGGGLGNSK